MKAFKSLAAISVLLMSAPAMAALGSTIIDCAKMPSHPDCISIPQITREDIGQIQVQMSPEDYENLRNMKSSYGRKFFAEAILPAITPEPALPSQQMNWQREQRRIQMEGLKGILKVGEIETLERVKVAVETQEQLDQKFGNGLPVRLSFVKKKN